MYTYKYDTSKLHKLLLGVMDSGSSVDVEAKEI